MLLAGSPLLVAPAKAQAQAAPPARGTAQPTKTDPEALRREHEDFERRRLETPRQTSGSLPALTEAHAPASGTVDSEPVVRVERIVDGLFISLLFFGCYLCSEPGSYPPLLRGAAWISLFGFVGLTVFVALALRWPAKTIQLALAATLIQRLAPKLAERLRDKLQALIHGFRALREIRHMLPFVVYTVLYWGSNGLGLWLLAHEMGLAMPLDAAYAAVAFTGVLISLPNAPGLVGQFHYGIIASLGAYFPSATVASYGGAYAIALHGIQFVWYVSLGFLALFFVGERSRSLRDIVIKSKTAIETHSATK
jgi:uncharacterized membrane protein YbhN (UPF0104 family)